MGRRTWSVAARPTVVVAAPRPVVVVPPPRAVVVAPAPVAVVGLPAGYIAVIPAGYTIVVVGGARYYYVGGIHYRAEFYQGRTVYVNEGGFKLEGPAPDCCDPEELIPREAFTNVVIRSASEEVKCRCRVRSAQESTNMKGFWMYGVQIVVMEDADRQQLRQMYIRAGFTSIKRR